MNRTRKKVIAFILCVLMVFTTVYSDMSFSRAEGENDGQSHTEVTADAAADTETAVTEQAAMEQAPVETQNTADEAADDNTGAVADEIAPVAAPATMELPNSSVKVITYVNGVETSIADAGVLKNGDKIEVRLTWTINNTSTDKIDSNTDMTYDLNATGVALTNNTGSVYSYGSPVGNFTIDDQGVLHIKITDSTLLGQSNINGAVTIMGEINVSELEEDIEGKVEAEIAGTKITVQKSDPTGTPSVNKTTVGDVYTGADGKIYQDYKVNVTANGSSSELRFTDTMGDWLSLVDGSFKVDGTAQTPDKDGQKLSYTFNNVSRKDTHEITYTLEIAPDAYASDFNTWDNIAGIKNKAEVQDTYGKADSTVSVSKGKNWIDKYSPSVDSATGEVVWTIVVNDGAALSLKGATLKDTLPDGLELVSGSVTIRKETWLAPLTDMGDLSAIFTDGGYTFPDDAAGKYVIQYRTTVSDAAGNSFYENKLTNTSTIETPDYGDHTDTADYTVGEQWAEKHVSSVDEENQTITWETVITIPDGTDIADFSYVDSLGSGLSGENGTASVDVEASVSGGGSASGLSSGTSDVPVTIAGSQFTVPFGHVQGPLTITLKYSTKYDPGNATKYTFTNRGWLTDGNNTSTPVSDSYNYENGDVDILNYKWLNGTDGTKATWGIQVKDVSKLRDKVEAGDHVYIYDTLKFTDDAGAEADIAISDTDFDIQLLYGATNQGITGEIYTGDASGKTIRFDITEHIKNNNYNDFTFTYTVDLGSEGIQNLLDGTSAYYKESNSAAAELEKEDGTKKDLGEIQSWDSATLQPADILTKNYEYTATTAPNAFYTIDVNPEGYTLLSTGETLKLTDTLGSSLQLKLSTVKLTSNGTDVTKDMEIQYDPDTRTLTVAGLADATPYKLSYEVYVNVPYQANTTFEELGVDVSNNCSLLKNGTEYKSVNRPLRGNVLRSSATAESAYGSIIINKYNGASVLAGAEFEIHAYKLSGDKTTFVPWDDAEYNTANPDATKAGTTIKTDINGEKIVLMQFDILYVLQETKAPAGYKQDSTPVYILLKGQDYADVQNAIANWEAANGVVNVQEKNSGDYQYVYNEESDGCTISVQKSDQNNNPVAGAGFTLYEANADGTGPSTAADAMEPIYEETDANGNITLDVAAGSYWLEETKVPTGYDEATRLTGKLITVGDGVSAPISVTEKVTNNKLYGEYKLTKYETGSTTPIAGATFGLYTKDADGNLQLVAEKDTAAGGTLTFDKLEWNVTYYIKEIAAPDGYLITDAAAAGWEFTPTGTEATDAALKNYADASDPGQLVYNDKEDGSIIITKVDADDNTILLDGVEFTLYDENKNVVYDVDGTTPVTAVTGNYDINQDGVNDSGVAVFSGLRYGTYYIRETKAPGIRDENVNGETKYYQYDLDGAYYEVEITNNTAVQKEITNKARELVTPYFNFYFVKSSTSGGALPGATFKLYKIDNTVIPDPENADYSAMTPVATAVSDASGHVYFLNVKNEGVDLSSGMQVDPSIQYVIVETSAPVGYYLEQVRCVVSADALHDSRYEKMDVIDSSDPADISSVNTLMIGGADYAPTNTPITAELSLVKKNETGAIALPGAVYGLYEGSTLLETSAASNAAGEISFTTTLQYGHTYVVKELTAPKGYARSDRQYTFTVGNVPADTAVSLTDSNTAELKYQIDARDTELSLSVSKQVLSENGELAGASLELYDSGNNLIDQWTSTTVPHVVTSSLLKAGETYILKEKSAPAGYGYSEDIRFMIQYDGTVNIINGANASVDGTTLTMRDGRINFSLAKVDESGNRLGNAIVQIKDDAGNVLYQTETGVSRDIVISPIMAKNYGIKAAENAGAYNHYVYHEEEAPNGYLQAADIRFAIDHSGQMYLCGLDAGGNCNGTHTAVANNRIVMTDKADTNMLFVRKGYLYGNGQYASVKGAELKIQKWDGTHSVYVDMSSDETWTTGYDAEAIWIPSLGVNIAPGAENKFRLVETKVPFGYKAAPPLEFTIIYNTSNQAEVFVDSNKMDGNLLTMIDEPQTVSIQKLRENGSMLSGARLELVDKETGRRIDYWTSAADAHKVNVSLLKKDGEYIIRELAVPYGYEPAKDIQFKLMQDDTTGDYRIALWNGTGYDASQPIETRISMTDNYATVTISKYAVGGSEEIDGARLTIIEDGTNRIVDTWTTSTAGGSKEISILGNFNRNTIYELREVTAPFGYEQAESVFFKIDENGRILVCDTKDGTYTQETQVVMEDAVQKLLISKQDLVGGQEIDGAKLVIKDEAGNVVVPEWISSGTGPKEIPVVGTFEPDKVYILTETTAPFGYDVAESIAFKFDADGNVSYKQESDTDFAPLTGDAVVMKDAPSYIYISKVDMEDSVEIAGAKLTITRKSDGHVMDTWTSQAGSSHPVKLAEKDFEPNVEYVLTEITAPDGFEIAESIVFKLDENGRIYVLQNEVFQALNDDVIVMEDARKGSVISIGKQDEDGALVDGAKLVITDADGQVIVPAWVSSSVQGAKLIEKSVFEAGKTYTLTELNAPAGYAYAADITFSLNADGDLYVDGVFCADNHIVMTDKLIRVYISKQDITNSNELPGAELVIKDADGNEIYSFVSGTEPTLIPSTVFTAPEDGALSYYTLTEITAPAGYEVAETISFAIDSHGVIYIKDVDGSYVTLESLGVDMIVMLDHPTVTDGKDTTTTKDGPKTGDKAPITLAVILAVLSLFGFVFLMKRRRNN